VSEVPSRSAGKTGGERFKHTTRPYKVEDVVKLQGDGDVPVVLWRILGLKP